MTYIEQSVLSQASLSELSASWSFEDMESGVVQIRFIAYSKVGGKPSVIYPAEYVTFLFNYVHSADGEEGWSHLKKNFLGKRRGASGIMVFPAFSEGKVFHTYQPNLVWRLIGLIACMGLLFVACIFGVAMVIYPKFCMLI